MTHRSADRLSDAIDDYLGGGAGTGSHLGEVLDALAGAFPDVAGDDARERVRRRVAGFRPATTGAPEVLAERAIDELRSLQRRLTEDDYVPWPTVVGAVAPGRGGDRDRGLPAAARPNGRRGDTLGSEPAARHREQCPATVAAISLSARGWHSYASWRSASR